MTEITAQIRINAPKDVVWAALADFGGIWKFNPSVTESRSLTKANSGVGAERHCDLTLFGASVDERIVEWGDSSMSVEIFDGKKTPPIDNVLARLEVVEDGTGSIARGTMTYTPRGVMGRIMDRMMVRKQFGKAWSGIFAGLKHYAETGDTVDKSTPLPYDDVVMAPA